MDSIAHEVWIKAPRETVFAALTTREGLDGWWGKALQAEPKVGSVVEFDHGLGDPMRMRITELVENERLAWRCASEFEDTRNPASDWVGHLLVFDLKPADDDPASAWLGPRLFGVDTGEAITVVKFQHTGWSPRSRWLAFCNAAWGQTLNSNLRNYCEA